MAGQQSSGATVVAVSTTSTQLLPSRVGNRLKRTQMIIAPTTAGLIATITKGDNPAVALAGIILQGSSYQSYIESTDGGYTCYQGAIQCVASGAGNVTVTESFEEV